MKLLQSLKKDTLYYYKINDETSSKINILFLSRFYRSMSISFKQMKFMNVLDAQNINIFWRTKLICCVKNSERNMIRMFTYLHVL